MRLVGSNQPSRLCAGRRRWAQAPGSVVKKASITEGQSEIPPAQCAGGISRSLRWRCWCLTAKRDHVGGSSFAVAAGQGLGQPQSRYPSRWPYASNVVFSGQALKSRSSARGREDREVFKVMSPALEGSRWRGTLGVSLSWSRRLEVGFCHAGSGPLGKLLVFLVDLLTLRRGQAASAKLRI